MYNKTIVACCDWGPWVLYTLGGKRGVQNAMNSGNNCTIVKLRKKKKKKSADPRKSCMPVECHIAFVLTGHTARGLTS